MEEVSIREAKREEFKTFVSNASVGYNDKDFIDCRYSIKRLMNKTKKRSYSLKEDKSNFLEREISLRKSTNHRKQMPNNYDTILYIPDNTLDNFLAEPFLEPIDQSSVENIKSDSWSSSYSKDDKSYIPIITHDANEYPSPHNRISIGIYCENCETIHDNNTYTHPCCYKTYCVDCISQWISTQLMDVHNKNVTSLNKAFLCINSKCKQTYSEEAILDHLNTNEIDIYIRKKEQIKSLNLKSNQIVCCPIPDCPSYAALNKQKHSKGKNILQCEYNHFFCKLCKASEHGNRPCKKEKNKPKGNFKSCPVCETLIEKESGCNHITCASILCRYEFCWLCLGKYSSNHYGVEDTACFGLCFGSEEEYNRAYKIIKSNNCIRKCMRRRCFRKFCRGVKNTLAAIFGLLVFLILPILFYITAILRVHRNVYSDIRFQCRGKSRFKYLALLVMYMFSLFCYLVTYNGVSIILYIFFLAKPYFGFANVLFSEKLLNKYMSII